MSKRILFVDYDGVLNDIEYLETLRPKHKTYEELDPQRIAYLRLLCSLTGAKIVLTSSWRDNKETLNWLSKRWQLPIIGKTPHKHENRGLEIHQWILDSKFDGQYLIIDDESSDLNETQREHLIITREPTSGFPTLGFQKKHIDFALGFFNNRCFESKADEEFLNCILEGIENDWLRVMWNIHQEEYDDQNPWRNTGNVKGYKNNVFEVHAYDWNWAYDDDLSKPAPINFKWRDLEITWYKYCGRGLSTNRPTTHDELAQMLKECLESLREEDNLYDCY